MKKTLKLIDKDNIRHNLRIEIEDGRLSVRSDSGQGKFNPKNDSQQQLLDIWDTWHLNDVNAGTVKQDLVLAKSKAMPVSRMGYANKVKWLSYHDIDGNPITGIEASNNKAKLSEIENKFSEWKESKEQLISVLKGVIKLEQDRWHTVPSTILNYSNLGPDLQASDKSGVNIYKLWNGSIYRTAAILKKVESVDPLDIQNLEIQRDELLLKSALYDIHPETGKPYKYGSEWLKRDLPENIEQTLNDLIEAIEETVELNTDSFEDLDWIDPKLAQFVCESLEIDLEELQDCYEDVEDSQYEIQGIEYFIGTKEDAKELLMERLEYEAWIFNPTFLSNQTGLDIRVFEPLKGLCEDANEPILAMIDSTCGRSEFVDEWMKKHHLGQILNRYDGKVDFKMGDYFIIRLG